MSNLLLRKYIERDHRSVLILVVLCDRTGCTLVEGVAVPTDEDRATSQRANQQAPDFAEAQGILHARGWQTGDRTRCPDHVTTTWKKRAEASARSDVQHGRATDGQHVHVLEDTFLATRHYAQEIRERIVAAATSAAEVVIDFSQVEAAAPGFLDELVCNLAASRAVTVRGMNEDVAECVELVLRHRNMGGRVTRPYPSGGGEPT